MENTAPSYPLVEKEIVPDLQFGVEEVYPDKDSQKKRLHDLERASLLGNGYQGKVEITFQVASGEILRVRTTIWQADAECTSLKSGASIPTRAILGVEYF